jgi:hypothetical protein
MTQPFVQVQVECYAGHCGGQTPRRLVLGERRVGVGGRGLQAAPLKPDTTGQSDGLRY